MSPAKSCPAGALARVEARASASGSGTGASARSRGTAPPSRSQRQRLSERDTQLEVFVVRKWGYPFMYSSSTELTSSQCRASVLSRLNNVQARQSGEIGRAHV